MEKRFTYGDQFSAGNTQGKIELSKIIELCEESLFVDTAGNRLKYGDKEKLRKKIGEEFFSHTADPYGNAGNTVLSLNAYGLIDIYVEEPEIGEDLFATTELFERIHSANGEEKKKIFARHILINLEGMLLLKIIEDMKARGEKLTLETLAYEFHELGIDIPANSTYISTMKSWLQEVNIFVGRYNINWNNVEDLVRIDKDLVDDLYGLNREHKYYLLALVNLGATEEMPSNKVASYVRSVFRIKITTKNLVKDILEPLKDLDLIETKKATTGRGAKPHLVKLSDKAKNELLEPFIERISELTELPIPTLNQPFDEVVKNLDADDTHVKGMALELLAVWIVRLLGLRFVEWRLRDLKRTGGGEVDVLAASDKFVYNRWQIQCKNTVNKVTVDEVAKEFGLTVLTNTDIILMITTSNFTSDARNYADVLMSRSRYYVVLMDGNDIDQIIEDKTAIIQMLNDKASLVFFRKEILSRNENLEEKQTNL